jgi:hypothetical protein
MVIQTDGQEIAVLEPQPPIAQKGDQIVVTNQGLSAPAGTRGLIIWTGDKFQVRLVGERWPVLLDRSDFAIIDQPFFRGGATF